MKEAGNLIYVIGKTRQELGGSQYYLTNGAKGGVVPRVDPIQSIKLMKKLTSAMKRGLVRSAHDCSEGGIAVSLAEMCFSGGLGAEVELKNAPKERSIKRSDVILFSESNSRFIVELSKDKQKAFERCMKDIPFGLIGSVKENNKIVIKGLKGNKIIDTDINTLKANWKKPISKVMHEEG
jgi:phosphoribosylformylglycinamidine synthase